MAQDAELKLKVSLDLGFFRQQLAGLGQAAAGYNIPIQIKFDRRSVQNELNALGANIRRRNYRLEVNTNLSAEIKKAKDLADALKGLEGKIKTGPSGFAKSQQGAAGLMEYMRSQGLSGGGGFVGVGRSTRLKNALEDLTIKQLLGLAKSEAIGGVSRLKKSALIDKLMNDLSQQAMENILGNAQMALRPPVRGIFAAGRTIAQGPLNQYGMAAGQAQGPTLPTRPIFQAGAALPGGAGQRYSFNNIGSLGKFPMAGMMGPSTPLTINARTSMFGGGGGGGGGKPPGGGFGGLGGFNLPGAGTIRELGTEFGFAAKQVLLFGTAYKALAFIQAFPGQVGQAVGQLQSFRNTLNTISPSAEEAASSNKLILDLVDRFNIPLQSARDGFTKLYASMAPAGFKGDEIRELFTGISKAAATFGMSADKVDRVNYAFAQMASKGQVMSEELKGQLGDVLPGALAIFAEAAGFKGPKAIQDFSVALEAGQYKGEAMVALLKNVGVVMNKEFGPGAEGAARTFQGVINRMENSMRLLYESFEPVAVSFLNTVVTPMTQGIRQISDGVNAFFSGTRAQTAGGFALAQELERLRPAFDGIKQNIAGVVQQLQAFGGLALNVSKILLQIAGNPFIGYLAKIYAIVLPLNMALNVMKGLWISNSAQLLIFNARVLAGTSTLTAFRGMMAATGATSQATATSIRTAGLTLRAFFSTTGIGLALVGISVLIERFVSLNQKLEETRAKAAGAAQAIQSMSSIEARSEEFKRQRVIRSLQQLQAQQTYEGGAPEVSPGMAKQFEEAGIPVQSGMFGGRRFIRKEMIPAYIQQQQGLLGAAQYQQKQLSFQQKQPTTPVSLAPISAGEGDGKGKGTKLREYTSEQINILQKRIGLNNMLIDSNVNLLAREKELQKAAFAYTTGLEIVKQQHALRIQDIGKLTAGSRGLAKAEADNMKTTEESILKQEYNKAVLGDLFDITDKYTDAIRDKELTIAGLSNATGELTEREKLEVRILNQMQFVRKEDLPLFKERIQLARALADRIDMLNKSEQDLLQTRKLQQDIDEKRKGLSVMGAGLGAGFYGSAAQAYETALLQPGATPEYAKQMADLETQAMKMQAVFGGIQNAIGGIGDAFGSLMTEGIASMIEGTATAEEVFSQFLKTMGQTLAQAGTQMIATYVAIGIARIFAGLSGAAASGGSTTTTTTGEPVVPGVNIPNLSAANGAVWKGGFQAFANGGVVNGPTLGLVGEGKYNEAIVPLPDGKAIPVQMQGDSIAEKMKQAQPQASVPMLSMSFETTKINGVEYVSKDQLQQAMMETQKLAAKEGAIKGANLAIDKLQQSPNVRKKVGIG